MPVINCMDDPKCAALSQTFQTAGQDICTSDSFKYFCNSTCSLCLATTTTAPTTKSVCSLAPCNQGICSVLPSGTFSCACDIGYTGVFCDEPCIDDGSCAALLQTFQTGGKDICSDLSFKHYCNKTCSLCPGMTTTAPIQTTKFDPCTLSPCKHGTCASFANGTFACTCSPGFTGLLCDTATGPCTNNPCVHGHCIEVVGNTFVCICEADYIGTFCDKTDPCKISPCQHGRCMSFMNGTFMCTCDPGYDGLLCDRADPCKMSPCQHGRCMSFLNGTFVCTCNAGYGGLLCDRGIRDCKDVLDNKQSRGTMSDVELILLDGHPTYVLCDMQTEGGGWTIIMNREDSTENFPDQSYSTYETGFGDMRHNFWAGLDKMHNLTSDGRQYQLRVELEVANGTMYTATYSNFAIGPPDDYVLHVGQYHGNAGDSLSGHNGLGFTTKERDNDINDGINCGWYLNGAWWFHTCYDSCLTCPYRPPGSDNKDNCRVFSWNALGYCIALKSAKLMIRPI